MFVAALYARRHHYPVPSALITVSFYRYSANQFLACAYFYHYWRYYRGGIYSHRSTAIAVIYSLALAMIYREITLRSSMIFC